MRLEQWIEKQRLSRSEFARQCGVSPATVTRILNGDRNPSAALIRKIAEVTKGKVTFKDWSPPPEDKGGEVALSA